MDMNVGQGKMFYLRGVLIVENFKDEVRGNIRKHFIVLAKPVMSAHQ